MYPELGQNYFRPGLRFCLIIEGRFSVCEVKEMEVTIHDERIDITEIPLFPKINWEPVLDDLKAEHLPGLYQQGRRMGVNIVDGKTHAYIYRTAKTPAEAEILAILARHGIS